MATASTSTRTSRGALDGALTGISKEFRGKLVASYVELKTNLAESRHDAAGLSAGKFCEIALRFLQQRVQGTHTPFGTKIVNFAEDCRALIAAPAGAATDSEHIILPRALVFLYTMRNKRGIGHVGGDVDANSIDIALMARAADWVVAELIRIHHGLSLEEAQDLIEAIAIRRLPDIWEVGGKKRVLRDGLTAKEETLLLLYSSKDSVVLLEDLMSWVEYSNPGVYRRTVLGDLHSHRLLEWDNDSNAVILSPKGAKYVEERILQPNAEA